MFSDIELSTLTGGCRREDLRKEVLTGGAFPGRVLARRGDEFLCEEDQSFLAEDSHPTAKAEDYVLVTIAV